MPFEFISVMVYVAKLFYDNNLLSFWFYCTQNINLLPTISVIIYVYKAVFKVIFIALKKMKYEKL